MHGCVWCVHVGILIVSHGWGNVAYFVFPIKCRTFNKDDLVVSRSIAVVFGSLTSSASSKPQTGEFVFGATPAPPSGSETSSAGTFAFGGGATSAAPSKPQRTDGGFAFRKRTIDDDPNSAKRSKGMFVGVYLISNRQR